MPTFVISTFYKGIIQSAHLIWISSRLCRFARRKCCVNFWRKPFKPRKISLQIFFLKAADIICPSLLASCGSVELKPTTSLQLTSRLQAAVGPHSDASAVFSLLGARLKKNKIPFSQRISTFSQFSECRPCPPLHLKLLYHHKVISYPLKPAF